MAVLYNELVAARAWLRQEDYALIFSLARITPGTNLLAFCAGVGWRLLGGIGAVLTVLGATLPSAALIVWVTYAYDTWKSNAFAMSAIAGMLAATVGMMGSGAWWLVRPHLGTRVLWRRWIRTALVLGGSALLSLGFSFSPIAVLALAALTGILWREPPA